MNTKINPNYQRIGQTPNEIRTPKEILVINKKGGEKSKKWKTNNRPHIKMKYDIQFGHQMKNCSMDVKQRYNCKVND